MKIPEIFDPIRPFEPDELPAVYDRLLADSQFQQVLKFLYPDIPVEMIGRKMRLCKTNLDFQKTFCYGLIEQIMQKASTGYEFDVSEIDTSGRYTFISNHRDIVLDGALLDKLLIDVGFTTTSEIAIGDNLLRLAWVKDLVRVNKSFIVERGLPLREMLKVSKRLSDYMHFVIAEKQDNIWIAQRQGRAKDSNDRTAEAVLKMMSMAGEGSIAERLSQLHLVPLSISYEFDPCDYLKAQELQCRRDVEGWHKGPEDDLISMKTGIFGFKGHVHYHCAPCIDDFLSRLDPEIPHAAVYAHIAAYIDREIHRNYRLYPCNYVALDLLRGGSEHASNYSTDDKAFFEHYLEGQLAKIQMPGKDVPFLREQILTMYANPAINYLSTL